MKSIAIELPNIAGKHEIEVDVKINGKKTSYYYKVEIFRWEDCDQPRENRVECIKQMVTTYDGEWSLAHIGMPTDDFIPITFQKKENKLESLV
ncbi:MAG: hypothetical protein KTR26_12810 [Flammeovirgaceae bacterium]|nr:hypothetical protein [Flammeovirgaceae bacterium]